MIIRAYDLIRIAQELQKDCATKELLCLYPCPEDLAIRFYVYPGERTESHIYAIHTMTQQELLSYLKTK